MAMEALITVNLSKSTTEINKLCKLFLKEHNVKTFF